VGSRSVLAVIIIANVQNVREAPDAVNAIVPRSVPTFRALPRPLQVSRDDLVPVKARQVVHLYQEESSKLGNTTSRPSRRQINVRDSRMRGNSRFLPVIIHRRKGKDRTSRTDQKYARSS
jgi:hypothetical protein